MIGTYVNIDPGIFFPPKLQRSAEFVGLPFTKVNMARVTEAARRMYLAYKDETNPFVKAELYLEHQMFFTLGDNTGRKVL